MNFKIFNPFVISAIILFLTLPGLFAVRPEIAVSYDPVPTIAGAVMGIAAISTGFEYGVFDHFSVYIGLGGYERNFQSVLHYASSFNVFDTGCRMGFVF